MKEKLINILKSLAVNNSWDLASDILNGLKNIETIKPRYITTIISFLENELKKSKDETRIKILKKAKNNLNLLKQKEEIERKKEEKDLEKLLLEF